MCGYWPFASFRCYATIRRLSEAKRARPVGQGMLPIPEITRGRFAAGIQVLLRHANNLGLLSPFWHLDAKYRALAKP